MSSKCTITFWDAAGKPTGMSINMDNLDGVGFDAEEIKADALAAALAAVSLSAQYTRTLSQPQDTGAPEDRGGLRGTKALVRWFSPNEGDGGQYGSNEIGAVDPDLFTVVGNAQYLQGANYDAIKAAFDNAALTENGNAVEVYEIQLVSRNI